MIEMTLHSVTVRCETLTQALVLLDSWAEMGRIKLPPAPQTATVEQMREASERRDAKETSLPSVPSPAKPTARKAPGTATEMVPCGVCAQLFDRPVESRLVTCRDHRLKPGQNLPMERKKYQAAKAKAGTKPAPKRQPDVAAAKGLLGRPPIKPNEATKACSECGDKTRVSELDKKDRCRDCHPVGDPS